MMPITNKMSSVGTFKKPASLKLRPKAMVSATKSTSKAENQASRNIKKGTMGAKAHSLIKAAGTKNQAKAATMLKGMSGAAKAQNKHAFVKRG